MLDGHPYARVILDAYRAHTAGCGKLTKSEQDHAIRTVVDERNEDCPEDDLTEAEVRRMLLEAGVL